jgi:hypothetical protein
MSKRTTTALESGFKARKHSILERRDDVFGETSDPIVKLAQALFCAFQMGYGAAHSDFVREAIEPLTLQVPEASFDDAIVVLHARYSAWAKGDYANH